MKSQKPLTNTDASLGDILNQLSIYFFRVKTNWKIFVKCIIVFGILGFTVGLLFQSDKKKAAYIIAAEEEGPSGMEGLLAQFGLDAGGSNPGGVFEGESLVHLFKIRSMIERTLLSEVSYNNKKVVIADLFWNDLRSSKHKVFEKVKFCSDRSIQNNISDSAVYLLFKYVNKELLSVSRPDKKQSFVTVSCSHENPDYAMIFTKSLIDNVIDFYTETITKKARYNLDVLHREVDSVQKVLNNNLISDAQYTDLNINPLMQAGRINQNRSKIDLQITITLYGELIKSLKLAEVSLRKQTPLIQIIETPQYPLENVGLKWWHYLLAGVGLGFIIAFYFANWSSQQELEIH
jgi:hypothetical protein